MEELTINVGTGPFSPNLVTIDKYEYKSNEFPISYEVEAQILWIYWDTSFIGVDKGFIGKIQRN